MTTYDNFKIVWFGVHYATRSPIIIEERIVAPSSKEKCGRKTICRQQMTGKPTKNIIHTQLPFRMNRIFQPKHATKSPFTTSSSVRSSMTESFSTPSFSSYGMFGYDNFVSSTLSSGVISPSVVMKKKDSIVEEKFLESVIQDDLDEKPNAALLVDSYVNHVILKKNIPKEAFSKFNPLDMYKKCIESNPVIKRLIHKDRNFLPGYLQDLIKASNQYTPSIKANIEDSNDYSFLYLSREIPENITFKRDDDKSAYRSDNDVSAELIKDNQEFKKFYQPILLTKTFDTKVCEEFLEMKNADRIIDVIDDLSMNLAFVYDSPDGEPRRRLMAVLKSSKQNLALLKELSLSVDTWLEGLLQGLFSKYKSIVEDTCLIIAFICFQPILAQTLINNCHFDVGRDIASAILKAMETKPYWFWIYYYALGYVIGCCERFSILEVIIEKVQLSKQPILLSLWPNFIYYATKFWKTKNLTSKHTIVFKITQFLEHCIFKKLSLGPAKRALITYSRRCSILCKFMTIWPVNGIM